MITLSDVPPESTYPFYYQKHNKHVINKNALIKNTVHDVRK